MTEQLAEIFWTWVEFFTMLDPVIRHIPTHFSEIMKDQFHERAAKNPAYSLRAFARDLGLTSGALSDILAKKVGVSAKRASAIAKKLAFEIEDRQFFCKLADANCAKKKGQRDSSEAELWKYDTSYTNIADDAYRIISDWHHFALVELVRIKGFRFENEWIAKRLGISVEEIPKAIQRLLNLELLEVVDGKLCQTYDLFVAPSGIPSDAARKFHSQVLQKASEALHGQKIEERDFTTGFFRTRTSDLPKIATRIKDFYRELAKEIESGEDHDSVYAFAVQFFRGDHQT